MPSLLILGGFAMSISENRHHSERIKLKNYNLCKGLGWEEELLAQLKGHDKKSPLDCGNPKCGTCGKSLKSSEKKSQRLKAKLELKNLFSLDYPDE